MRSNALVAVATGRQKSRPGSKFRVEFFKLQKPTSDRRSAAGTGSLRRFLDFYSDSKKPTFRGPGRSARPRRGQGRPPSGPAGSPGLSRPFTGRGAPLSPESAREKARPAPLNVPALILVRSRWPMTRRVTSPPPIGPSRRRRYVV